MEKALTTSKALNKDLTLSKLKMVDGVLDQLLAAKTAEEFNNAIQLGMPLIGGLIGPLMPTQPQEIQTGEGMEEGEEAMDDGEAEEEGGEMGGVEQTEE